MNRVTGFLAKDPYSILESSRGQPDSLPSKTEAYEK